MRDGDLLYLGTWKQPQVLSLGRASSAGMATPLAHDPWFPGGRAFIATAPRVQIAIYSEAPRTDFSVASVEVIRLIPGRAGGRRRLMPLRQDVLCISSIDWDFIWQGHQEIMSTLAAEGHRVLFLENTGVRAPNVRDLPRVRQRVRNWWRGTKGFREERPNLFVYSPIVLPLPYSRVARWVNRWLLMRALQALDARRPASTGRSRGRSCRRRSRSI